MSCINDTEKVSPPQGVYWNEDDWQSVLKRLPPDWEEQAIRRGAWQRVRKLARITDLLRALLVYAACGYCLRELGLWATVVGLGSLSERAWRKRLERSQGWIGWLLGALIGTQASPGWLPQTVGRILLLDASRLATPAGCGEDVKMHTTYNLRQGQLEAVEVGDRHSAEGLQHVVLHPGDVIVTDAGYPLGSSVQQGQAQGAWGVHRFSDHHVRLEREDGKKIDVKRLVKHQRYGTVCEYSAWIWDPKHRERFAIRLIISLAPRQQVMAARARKQERLRRKKGSKANLAPAWWVGVMLLGTTLPKETWPAQDVVKLYRARWQIELFFKRLKQGLQLHWVPIKQWCRAQTYVHLCLIVWALQEDNAQQIRQLLADAMAEPEVGELAKVREEEREAPKRVISHWRLERCALETLQTLLRGSWTRQRLRDSLPDLQRYLVSRDRQRRRSQETEVQAWLFRRFGLSEMEDHAS